MQRGAGQSRLTKEGRGGEEKKILYTGRSRDPDFVFESVNNLLLIMIIIMKKKSKIKIFLHNLFKSDRFFKCAHSPG